MHVRYMRVRVCIYVTCVYVYAFTLQVCTCMHVRYMCVRVCIYVYSCMGLAYIHVYSEVKVRVHMHEACMYVYMYMYGTCHCHQLYLTDYYTFE